MIIIDNDCIPLPSDMDDIDIDSEYSDYEQAFVNIVTVDVDDYAKTHFEKEKKRVRK